MADAGRRCGTDENSGETSSPYSAHQCRAIDTPSIRPVDWSGRSHGETAQGHLLVAGEFPAQRLCRPQAELTDLHYLNTLASAARRQRRSAGTRILLRPPRVVCALALLRGQTSIHRRGRVPVLMAMLLGIVGCCSALGDVLSLSPTVGHAVGGYAVSVFGQNFATDETESYTCAFSCTAASGVRSESTLPDVSSRKLADTISQP
jgi:hypothetical protein